MPQLHWLNRLHLLKEDEKLYWTTALRARLIYGLPLSKKCLAEGESLMAIAAPWWSLAEQVIRFDQNRPGVYELGDGIGTVVYIGSAADVQRRLLDHLKAGGTTCVGKHATQYRVEYTGEDHLARARQLYDQHLREFGAPPVCNEARP
jgi:hypothetical protein